MSVEICFEDKYAEEMSYQIDGINNYLDTFKSKTYFTNAEMIEAGCKICKHDKGINNSCGFRDKCLGWCPWFSPKNGIIVEHINFNF